MVNTAYLCEHDDQGIRILEYRSLDGLAAVPERIDGRIVTSLAPYLFSVHENYNDEPHPHAFWWSGEGGTVSWEAVKDLPAVKGDFLTKLRLPAGLKQVGAYALYNCDRLQKLELYSSTLDWGTGVFTGCVNVKDLVIHVDESRRSCLKEILAELRHTLTVTYDGAGRAVLVFPEFFEEAVENTPARILVTNTHGCGQKYRNAFVQTQFQFKEYDSLFPHVQVQEPEELVTELALRRVMDPYGLTQEYRARYMEYLTRHKISAACRFAQKEESGSLKWLLNEITYEPEALRAVIEAAGKNGNTASVSLLMDKAGMERKGKRRRFSL